MAGPSSRLVGGRRAAEAERGGQRRDEAALLLGLGRRAVPLLLAHARLRKLQDAPRGEAAELLEELRAEVEAGIGGCAAGVLGQALGDDEARLGGGACLLQPHRSGLLDAIDIGLRQRVPHRAVEVAETGDQHDRGRHPVGDLDEIAHRLLEAFLRIVEEAQILDLIDAEDERRAVDGPHQASERLDDLEGARPRRRWDRAPPPPPSERSVSWRP